MGDNEMRCLERELYESAMGMKPITLPQGTTFTAIAPLVFVIEIGECYDMPDDLQLAQMRDKAKASLPPGAHVIILAPGMKMRQIAPDAPTPGAIVHIHGGIYVDASRVLSVVVTVDLSVKVSFVEGAEIKAYLFRAEADGDQAAMKLAMEIMERVNSGRFLTVKADGMEVPVSVAEKMRKIGPNALCQACGAPAGTRCRDGCVCEQCEADLKIDIAAGALTTEELRAMYLKGSKAVDADGKPTLHYHGTTMVITGTIQMQQDGTGESPRKNLMYERFTDRARKVMQLATQEAQRFNHEYIGTEHILLGLVKEGSGVAANVLKNFSIFNLAQIRLEVEKIVQAGPDMVTMGKLPQTPNAKKVLEYAIEEARNLNHNYVGTEHLLLGLLKVDTGVACDVLTNLGVRADQIREEILLLLKPHKPATEPAHYGDEYRNTHTAPTAYTDPCRCCYMDDLGNQCQHKATLWVGKDGIDNYTHACDEHAERLRADGDVVMPLHGSGQPVLGQPVLAWIDETPGSHVPTPDATDPRPLCVCSKEAISAGGCKCGGR